MKKNTNSIRLFKNPFLERLTHAHPVTTIVIFSLVIGFFSYRAWQYQSGMIFFACFIVGLIGWTLIEYIIHRGLYHFNAKNRIGIYLVFLVHGVHHDTPRDVTRLVAPLVMSIAAFTFILLTYMFLFGKYAEGVFVGTMTGYLIYDLIHFSVHVFNFKNPIFKFLKHYHFHHHYVEPDKAFGVSTPFWDVVFKTIPHE